MHRWSKLIPAILSAATLGWVWLPRAAAEARPNVLFIAVDDLRPELRCYGAAHIHSPDVEDGTLYDGQVADTAVAALRQLKRKPEQPFFLAVGFIKPHSPYIAPAKYFDLYDAVEIADDQMLPDGAPAFAGHGSGELRRYTDQPRQGEISDDRATMFAADRRKANRGRTGFGRRHQHRWKSDVSANQDRGHFEPAAKPINKEPCTGRNHRHEYGNSSLRKRVCHRPRVRRRRTSMRWRPRESGSKLRTWPCPDS